MEVLSGDIVYMILYILKVMFVSTCKFLSAVNEFLDDYNNIFWTITILSLCYTYIMEKVKISKFCWLNDFKQYIISLVDV